MPLVRISSQRTKMREFLNAGLSDCCVCVISSWDVQSPLLFRCSRSVRSHHQERSYHPVGRSLFCTPLSHLSPLSSFIIPFLKNHGFFIARSVPSIFLPARPSVPLRFDVSLILLRPSAVVISAIFQRCSRTSSCSLFHALLSSARRPSFCLCGVPSPRQNPLPFSSSYFSF